MFEKVVGTQRKNLKLFRIASTFAINVQCKTHTHTLCLYAKLFGHNCFSRNKNRQWLLHPPAPLKQNPTASAGTIMNLSTIDKSKGVW